MKKRFNNTLRKITCVICAVGTYIMAFMAADMFEREIPMDFMSGISIIMLNAAVVYLFIVSGFDIISPPEEEIREVPRVTAEGFDRDYYDTYFREGDGNGGKL